MAKIVMTKPSNSGIALGGIGAGSVDTPADDSGKKELYDWFKTEATSDSLQEALTALSDDYEEEEIRLVRIKFLCEVAN